MYHVYDFNVNLKINIYLKTLPQLHINTFQHRGIYAATCGSPPKKYSLPLHSLLLLPLRPPYRILTASITTTLSSNIPTHIPQQCRPRKKHVRTLLPAATICPRETNPLLCPPVNLDTLEPQQLAQVKKQLDEEIEHLTQSFSQLHGAQNKFKECLRCVKARSDASPGTKRAAP